MANHHAAILPCDLQLTAGIAVTVRDNRGHSVEEKCVFSALD